MYISIFLYNFNKQRFFESTDLAARRRHDACRRELGRYSHSKGFNDFVNFQFAKKDTTREWGRISRQGRDEQLEVSGHFRFAENEMPK